MKVLLIGLLALVSTTTFASDLSECFSRSDNEHMIKEVYTKSGRIIIDWESGDQTVYKITETSDVHFRKSTKRNDGVYVSGRNPSVDVTKYHLISFEHPNFSSVNGSISFKKEKWGSIKGFQLLFCGVDRNTL